MVWAAVAAGLARAGAWIGARLTLSTAAKVGAYTAITYGASRLGSESGSASAIEEYSATGGSGYNDPPPSPWKLIGWLILAVIIVIAVVLVIRTVRTSGTWG